MKHPPWRGGRTDPPCYSISQPGHSSGHRPENEEAHDTLCFDYFHATAEREHPCRQSAQRPADPDKGTAAHYFGVARAVKRFGLTNSQNALSCPRGRSISQSINRNNCRPSPAPKPALYTPPTIRDSSS